MQQNTTQLRLGAAPCALALALCAAPAFAQDAATAAPAADPGSEEIADHAV